MRSAMQLLCLEEADREGTSCLSAKYIGGKLLYWIDQMKVVHALSVLQKIS